MAGPTPRVDLSDDDALVAVMAHGLLTSMTVVTGSIGLLREAWDELDPVEREAVLAKAEEQALHVGAVLNDLVRGLPPEALRLLDELRQEA
jgi:signal transduction histidine kinase